MCIENESIVLSDSIFPTFYNIVSQDRFRPSIDFDEVKDGFFRINANDLTCKTVALLKTNDDADNYIIRLYVSYQFPEGQYEQSNVGVTLTDGFVDLVLQDDIMITAIDYDQDSELIYAIGQRLNFIVDLDVVDPIRFSKEDYLTNEPLYQLTVDLEDTVVKKMVFYYKKE